jgi:hypothetical protein
MKAGVPYLARLARSAAGQPALRPPRPPFSGDIDLPADPSGYLSFPRRPAAGPGFPGSLPAADGDGEQPAPEAPTPASQIDGTPTAGRPGGSAALEPVVAGNAPARPARPEPAAPSRTKPDPDLPRPPRAAPQRPGPAEVSGAAVASPAGIRPVAPAAERGPARDARPAADGPARPPESWASSLSDGPVAWPDALQPALRADQPALRAEMVPRADQPALRAEMVPRADQPALRADQADRRADQADRRAEMVPRVGPARPGPGGPAGSRQHQGTGDASGAAAHRTALGPAAPAARDLDRPREPAAVRDLAPQPASDPPPIAISGTGPGEPRVPRRPRVSIGTIEVTVVPPAPAAPEIRLPAPVTPGRSRPPSPFAASAGADRLRHGLRRWYGTAQE